jgi:hypothetical protein
LNDPLDPRDFGLWQAKLDFYMGDTSFTAAILPFFQPCKIPSVRSPWVAGALTADLPDFVLNFNGEMPFSSFFELLPGSFDGFVEAVYFFWDIFLDNLKFLNVVEDRVVRYVEDLPGSRPGDTGWFGRTKTSLGEWDLFVSAYQGPGFYPVLKWRDRGPFVDIIMEYPDVFNLGAGFSTTWKALEFHGEALYNRSSHRRDDSYVNYVGGMTYLENRIAKKLHLDEIAVTLEYAGEKILSEQDNPQYLVSSRYARLGRDDIFASLRLGITDDLSLHYLADLVLWDRSRFHRMGASYRIRPGLVLGVSLELFEGDGMSYFGRWRKNDRLVTMLKWSF